MKRFLIPLLAALAIPNAVKAESFYLLVNVGAKWSEYGSSFVVPMKTLDGCEEAGLKIISSDRFKLQEQSVAFECLQNK